MVATVIINLKDNFNIFYVWGLLDWQQTPPPPLHSALLSSFLLVICLLFYYSTFALFKFAFYFFIFHSCTLPRIATWQDRQKINLIIIFDKNERRKQNKNWNKRSIIYHSGIDIMVYKKDFEWKGEEMLSREWLYKRQSSPQLNSGCRKRLLTSYIDWWYPSHCIFNAYYPILSSYFQKRNKHLSSCNVENLWTTKLLFFLHLKSSCKWWRWKDSRFSIFVVRIFFSIFQTMAACDYKR